MLLILVQCLENISQNRETGSAHWQITVLLSTQTYCNALLTYIVKILWISHPMGISMYVCCKALLAEVAIKKETNVTVAKHNLYCVIHYEPP